MEKEISKTINDISVKHNQSYDYIVKEVFNYASYLMITNSLLQITEREIFYMEDKHRIVKPLISITDRIELKADGEFCNKFECEIINIANLINNEIFKNPLTDVFKKVFEACYLKNKKGNGFAQYLTPDCVADGSVRFLSSIGAGINTDKQKYVFNDLCGGTGALVFPFLRNIFKNEGFKGIQKIELIYNDKDPFIAQLFSAQLLTNIVYHNLDFKLINIFVSDAITEYDNSKDGSTLFIKMEQNKLIAEKILRLDRMEKSFN